MAILGYGEDSLTFHALTTGLPGILNQLKDDTDPNTATVFFRPSFGRRSSPKSGPMRSEFGEFDGIIGTARAVYLVEAKWPGSGKLGGTDLRLRPEQVRRHQAFRIYLDEWRRERPSEWATFAEHVRPALGRLRLSPPHARTKLARNLEYVLSRLESCGTKTADVLLFCRLSESTSPPSSCGGFCIVTHLCHPEDGSSFIRLLA